jgi:DNA primase
MAGIHFSEEFLSDLQSRVPIGEYISSFNVELKSAGANSKARCPLPDHDDKTPSFNVIHAKDFCYCHGCGGGGNVFAFTQQMTNASFIDAVKAVADYAGVELPRNGNDRQPDRVKQAISKKLFRASQIYQANLSNKTNQSINDLIAKRNIRSSSISKYGIGAAKNDWNQIKNILGGLESKTLLTSSGLTFYSAASDTIKEKFYDRFRDGIIFPIKDLNGEVVSFAIRHKDGVTPKYMNGAETEVFKKSEVLYGLYEATQNKNHSKGLTVVEGYIDVIKMDQYGFHNTVATMGTSLTDKHIQLLLRKTNNLTFCFDGDKAGLKAAKRTMISVLPYVDDHHTFKFSLLEKGQDPDSLLESKGAEEMAYHLDKAELLSTFVFRVFWEGKDINSRESVASAANEFCGLLEQMTESNFKRDLAKQFELKTGLPLKQSLTISVSGKDLLPGKVMEISKDIRNLVANSSGAFSSEVDIKISSDNYKPTSSMDQNWSKISYLPSNIPSSSTLPEKMNFLNKAMENVLVNSNLKYKDDSGIAINQLLMDSFRNAPLNETESRLKQLSQYQLKMVLEKHDFINMINLLSTEANKITKLAMHICQTHPAQAAEVKNKISQLSGYVNSNLKYLDALGRFSPNQTYGENYNKSLIIFKNELRSQAEKFLIAPNVSASISR